MLGLARLQASCESGGKQIHLELFERYDLEEADPKPFLRATRHRVPDWLPPMLTNYLAFARRGMPWRCVLDQLRQMTTSEEEFRREAQVLLGVKFT